MKEVAEPEQLPGKDSYQHLIERQRFLESLSGLQFECYDEAIIGETLVCCVALLRHHYKGY
jgi:hypothetical protein